VAADNVLSDEGFHLFALITLGSILHIKQVQCILLCSMINKSDMLCCRWDFLVISYQPVSKLRLLCSIRKGLKVKQIDWGIIRLYDIVIVGAGPAGATLARLISPKYKVLIVDKRFDPARGSTRGKCCGGLLAPDAQKALGRIGVALPGDVLVGPQIFKVRAIDLHSGLEKYYQRFYINMDRDKFDHWLISLLPPAVETRFGRRLAGIESNNGYRIHLYSESGKETIGCKVLVGADGASSIVRRQLFPSAPGPRRYLAIQEWFPATEIMPYYSAVFEPAITDFYSWIIPKENFLVLGAALTPDRNAFQRYSLLKKQLNQYGFSFGKAVKEESALILRPARSGEIFTGRGQAILIGEAAGLISPSSAEGLSYAFNSALLASEALSSELYNPVTGYNKLAASLRNNIKLKLLKSSLIYCTPTRRAGMTSGLFSIKPVIR
jgi:geranylgeranyl diphosphate/geranylgeranyl-bacteriochlorophyllide a reductase